MTAFELVMLGAATATCSMTVSKSSISRPLHAWAARSGFKLLRELLDCPYCLSHWFAVLMVLWAGLPLVAPHTLAVIGVATVLIGLMSRLLFIPEYEKNTMKAILGEVHAEMAQLRQQLKEANGSSSRESPPSEASGAEVQPSGRSSTAGYKMRDVATATAHTERVVARERERQQRKGMKK